MKILQTTFRTIFILCCFFIPFHLKSDEVVILTENKATSRYLSVYANFYFPNLNNTDKLINEFGFDKVGFTSNMAFEKKRSIRNSDLYYGAMLALPIFHTKKDIRFSLDNGEIADRVLEYSTIIMGLTFDKRFTLYDKLEAFTGVTCGLAYHEMNLSQILYGYSWDIQTNEKHENFSYRYILNNWYFQPRLMLLYQIIEKHHIRFEVGYIIDFLNNTEWKMRNGHLLYPIQQAPKTDINGLTFNIGWSRSF